MVLIDDSFGLQAAKFSLFLDSRAVVIHVEYNRAQINEILNEGEVLGKWEVSAVYKTRTWYNFNELKCECF